MRHFGIFAGILTVITLMFSSSARGATPESGAEWTVMIYMNAKNNLECDGLNNFKQIASVGGSADVNVVVEFGRPRISSRQTARAAARMVAPMTHPGMGCFVLKLEKI